MLTFVYEYPAYYQILVTDGTETNSFSYNWGKDQDLETSEREALLLAESEIASRQAPVMVL
ncbi:hypothetical protein [Paenibacillus sp. sgz302251]|uniref:hypothetical protein n=1 Tax=Paenibacillus sp. sgz302251 TaxID=3414493 RepID=UPI003C7B211F